ncbi:hypothetical protein QQF64_003880 [Cirrhinus molitorella]|uniref:Uncharacterized protein n=1 Tax=Cirrhinus molitorella TaxID=172907 RepID=A0ABR3MMK0_9TELE
MCQSCQTGEGTRKGDAQNKGERVRGKKRGGDQKKERQEKSQALSVLWGCHIPSRGCRELCLRACREGLQVENDNHPGSAANLSALLCVSACVCVCVRENSGGPPCRERFRRRVEILL